MRSLCIGGIVGLLTLASTAVAEPPPHIVYVPIEVANALHDGGRGTSLAGAMHQGPASTNGRWPLSRQMTKVRARDLAPLGTGAMTRLLRQELNRRGHSGVVGVDEIAPSTWTAARARRLASALDALGGQRNNVVLYASAAMFGGVGRVDPRRGLGPRHRAILGAMRRAGAVYLETYRGDRSPVTPVELATWSTRWRARWPGDPRRLRLILGPGGSADAELGLWRSARASAAGRALLANGVAVWGLRTNEQASGWLAGFREFVAAPGSPPPGGDVGVPVGGGLALSRRGGGPLVISLARPARVVVQLLRPGARDGRVIRKLNGPFGPTRVPIPRDTRPGRYIARVIAIGDGLRDERRLSLRVRRR